VLERNAGLANLDIVTVGNSVVANSLTSL